MVESRFVSAGLNAIGIGEPFFVIAGNLASSDDAVLVSIWVGSLVGGLSAVCVDSWDRVGSGSLVLSHSYGRDSGEQESESKSEFHSVYLLYL